MSAKRVVIVDDNALVLRLVSEALAGPDFEVLTFSDSREALFKLHQIRPDLIISDLLMPGMDGREFFQLVKRSPELRGVPFIFLSSVQSNAEIIALLERGVDDFVNKPITLQRLQAKVRATLRLAERGQGSERRQDRLIGSVLESGTLPLIRFCEDVRLSGRLSVSSDGVEHWAEFLGGELIQAGDSSGAPEADPIDALLALRHGAYEIAQRSLDPQRLQALQRGSESGVEAQPVPDEPAEEAAAPVHLPGGRLARVAVRGVELEIQTEAENRPNFVITTIVARAGRVVRKIEGRWAHALQRQEDEELARTQLDRQHERVLASVRSLGLEPPAPAEPAYVDGALLAWAASFIAEQVRDLLGTVMTTTLLRRTRSRVGRQRPLLEGFAVASDGRVSVAPEAASLQPAAVAAVAAWMSECLSEATEIAEGASRIRVRQATHLMESELDGVGFYAALSAAAGRSWD